MNKPFHSIYTHHFLRSAVCIPKVKIADPAFNVAQTIGLAKQASAQHAAIALFPELGISGYTNDDLFHQDSLLDASLDGLQEIVDASTGLTPVIIVGLPIRFEYKLFNCAAVIYQGRLLGLLPKTYLPNYREFYEKRQFAAQRDMLASEVRLFGEMIPFGNDLIFGATNVEGFALHAEICEDVWTPIPPSTQAALAGATVLTNLSASNITVGKAEYRRSLCASQSARCLSAYLYAASGFGESTTDLAWDGHGMIYENGTLLAETERFSLDEQVLMADIDLERLTQDRMRLTSFSDQTADLACELRKMRHIPFEFEVPQVETKLQRSVDRFPYVPSNPALRDERCSEVYNIQVQGLMQRDERGWFREVGDWGLRWPRFDPGPHCGCAYDGSDGVAAVQYPGLYHAWVCHVGAHVAERTWPDEGAWRYGPRN